MGAEESQLRPSGFKIFVWKYMYNSDFLCGRPRDHEIVAAVTSGLLTIVKTGITIVSYFGDVTASLFALTTVRKFTPR